MSKSTKSIGRNLRNTRKARNMTLQEVAESIGKSRTLISKYEHGTNLPTLRSLIELAEMFGITIEDLLEGDDSDDSAGTDSRHDCSNNHAGHRG